MNAKKTYLSRYRHSLPVFFPNKRRLLKHMDQYLEDYLEAHSNASIEDILTELGTPEQHMLVIIMIVVVFLFMIYGTYNYIQNHWIATIVYETAVEGTYPPDAE